MTADKEDIPVTEALVVPESEPAVGASERLVVLLPESAVAAVEPSDLQPRIFAHIIDRVIVGVTWWVLGMVFAFLVGPFVRGQFPEMYGYVVLGSFVLVDFLYFTILESSPSQATAGKRVVGIKVVDDQGQRLSFARASARTLMKYVTIYPLLPLGLVMALNERRKGLHDMVARTFVVGGSKKRQ